MNVTPTTYQEDQKDPRPIGVFDSGVGGLTVLKGLVELLPYENWIYLGDTARLPFGTKSPETIKNYTKQNLKFLAQRNCKAFVIACNSASTQFSEHSFENIPVFNVIDPGVEAAIDKGLNLKMGIIGTKATIKSRIYENKLKTKNFKGPIYSEACPLFVPIVEEGLLEGPICQLIIDKYLKNLKKEKIEALILACTHYPLLKKSLREYFDYHLEFISSEKFLAEAITKSHVKLNGNFSKTQSIQILTTDDYKNVEELAKNILSSNSISKTFPQINFETADLIKN
ncbi:MAG: glutamate racemase [Bdellovibrionaceae bacterium]|nr:glutamate racemase [Pseudobdellovibrionaceae bacterium]